MINSVGGDSPVVIMYVNKYVTKDRVDPALGVASECALVEKQVISRK